MDFWKALEELHAERERLSKMIASLEAASGMGSRRRGRKSMSAAERRQVSERMKQYWASRRRKSSRTKKATG
jgi:hypothetical protein